MLKLACLITVVLSVVMELVFKPKSLLQHLVLLGLSVIGIYFIISLIITWAWG